MALVPLDLKPGFYRNGTELEASNRWRDGSLVRWIDGSLKPIGGWAVRKANFCNNIVRGMLTWQTNTGQAYIAGGSYDQLIAMTGGGVTYDLTPDDLAVGREDAIVNTGYGSGFYGVGYYGQPIAVTSSTIPQEASTWQLQNFGQNLIALSSTDGRIFQWDLNTTIGAELVTNGDFAVDANWTKGANWSISGGASVYAQYKPIINANSNSVTNYFTNKITITGHNFSNGDEIKYVVPSGQTAINGLTSGTNYFVVNATTNDLQLSATSGGSAISFTSTNFLIFDADNNSVKDTTNNKIVASNTFSNGNEVQYSNGGGSDIGGLVNNQNYFIVNASGSEFQLAATSGGSAIDLTPDLNASFDPDPITTSATSITVTVANVGGVNKYHFGGVTAPAITLIRGTTYTFDMSDATNANHPLIFQNGGSNYTTGITTTGVAGNAGASVTFAVPNDAPATGLTYLCQIHGAAMGNSITTVTASEAAGPIDYSTETITIANHGFSNGDEVTYNNGGGTNISGLATGTNYFVIGATTNTFQLASTSGGSAINLTAPGSTLGTGHTFDVDIGSSHIVVQQIGTTHELQRQNFGNLDQTVTSLVAAPDVQDTYDLTVTLIDPNTDNNAATVPIVKIKVTGTTTNTVSVNETLAVGSNIFRFGADDTTVKIEIIPLAYNTPDFNIDGISLKKKTVVEPLVNAPVNNKGIVVTEERFLFALGSGGNSRKVSWCDKEDLSTWTAAATNEAGDIELVTSGQIMAGLRTRGGTLIITDTDTHLATYQGPPYVYGFQRISTNSGAVSRLSAVSTDQGAFWFGAENFYYFDGNSVQTLQCDVHDYVFGDFNSTQQSKIWGMVDGANSEIWWFYCSANSNECDRYVAYDYKDNHWLIGNLARTAGVSRGVFKYPFMASHGTTSDILNHEVGFNYDNETVFCETGAIVTGNGDEILRVTEVIPDERTQGDVNLKFKSKFLPNDTERIFGPFNPTNPTSVRFSGRQIKMRVEGDQTVDWRVGIMRLDIKSGGRR